MMQGNKASGLLALRKAFVIGRENNYVVSIFMNPEMMSSLCVKALENNIEVDYVSKFIQHNNWLPDTIPSHLENWPWKLKIYTIERFRILKHEKTLTLSSMTINFVKAIITCGGKDVHENEISDILWPETDGDKAHQNFKTALHRTRKVIGSDSILLKNSRISLNPKTCWVDAWVIESCDE